MIFNYDNESKRFDLKKSNAKEKVFGDKMIFEIPKKKIKVLKTFEAFIKYFPNIANYQISHKKNPFDIIKELSINVKIMNYLNIISEYLVKEKVIENNLDIYYEKLTNYIFSEIYEKLYPPKPFEMDNKIFDKSKSLSWIEPKNIFEKEYVFDNILPDILKEFERINLVKTPNKKLNCIEKIYKLIISLIRLNEGEDYNVGIDDITPIFFYIIIKAHPFRIFSDIEYIKVFLNGDYVNKHSLIHLEVLSIKILNSDSRDYNISEVEYEKKCKEAMINNKNNEN